MKTLLWLVSLSLTMTAILVFFLLTLGVLRWPLDSARAGQPATPPATLPPAQVATPTPPRQATAVGVRAAPTLPASSLLLPAKDLFSRNCARCHGEGGDGVLNVNLASASFISRRGEANLMKSISLGRGIMPAFADGKGGDLSEAEIESLYKYLQGVAGVAPAPTAAAVVSGSGAPQPDGQQPPSEIPHGVKGWEDKCLSCHGRDGFAPVKVSHAGRRVRTCLFCHRIKEGVPEYAVAQAPRPPSGTGVAPKVPHVVTEGRPPCEQCHSAAGIGAPSAVHEKLKPTPCAVCHWVSQSQSAPVPPAPRR